LYLNLSTRAASFKVKKLFTLMMSVPRTLPFLLSPKVTYSLCDRRMRLENHFLFPVMCREQPKSMSHISFKPPSITSESELQMFLKDLSMRQRPVKSSCLRLTFSSSSKLEESSLEKLKSLRAAHNQNMIFCNFFLLLSLKRCFFLSLLLL
jgi:hypothetical protein